ncbi:InlB B-repeat-containing protein [Lancefieldella rimae]
MRKRKIREAVLSALLAFLLACPTPVLAQVALGVSGTQAQESASQPEDASSAQETDSTEKVLSEEAQVEDKQVSQGSAAAETNAETNAAKKDGTKDDGVVPEDSSKADTLSPTASNNSNEKQILAQATWSATASDGTSVTVSGNLPQGGKVSAALASASIAGEKIVLAYDITIYDANGTKWEPNGSAIAVTISSSRMPSGSVSVWHVPDGSSAEKVVDTTANTNSVSFQATGFSVYAVTVPNTHFTQTYRFHVKDASGTDTVVSEQKLSDAEKLTQPATPSGNGTFSGWTTSSGQVFNGFGKTAQELNGGAALDATTEATPIDLYASFDATGRHIVYFMSASEPASVLDSQVYADGTAIRGENVLPLVNTGNPEIQTIGWSRTKGATTPDASLGTVNGNDVYLWPVLREGHSITFDSAGGSVVATEYVDRGSVTTEPTAPTKTGYTFAGWKTEDGSSFTFGSELPKSVRLTATWTPNANTSYQVNYWIQKATDPYNAANADKTYAFYTVKKYTAATDSTVTTATSEIAGDITSVKSQFQNHLKFNGERSDSSAVVAADGSTVFNVYLDRELMRINFYNSKSDYDSDANKTGVEEYSGNAAHTFLGLYEAEFEPVDPGEGYRWLDGIVWYAVNPHKFSSNRISSNRINYWRYPVKLSKKYAVFSENADGSGYTSDFSSWLLADGRFNFWDIPGKYYYVRYGYYTPTGDPKDPTQLNLDTDITTWFDVSKKEGPAVYGDGKITFNPIPTKYLVMVADRVPYTLTLAHASTAVTSQTTISTEQRKYDASLADIASSTPTRPSGLPSYYQFAGWYRNADLTLPVTAETKMPATNTTLYAKWTPASVKVTYVYNNGDANKTVSIKAGDCAEEPTGITRDGYVLAAWLREDGRTYTFDSPVTEDITLTAKWVPVSGTHRVIYDLAGGSGSVTDDTLYAEGSDTHAKDASGVTPPSGSAGFVCWMDANGVRYYPGDVVKIGSGDITLTAVWANSNAVRIAYDLNYDGAPAPTFSEYAPSNSKFTIDRPDPTRSGYRFLGWSTSKTGGNLLHQGDVVVADTIEAEGNVLYAQWERIPSTEPNEPATKTAKGDSNHLPDTGNHNVLLASVSIAATGFLLLFSSALHRRRETRTRM